MHIVLLSITSPLEAGKRKESFGQYRVVLSADGREHVLTYTVELKGKGRSVSWQPSESILADSRIDVLIVAALTDLVVAFHRGDTVPLPCDVPPLSVGPDTAVIRP
ncbi:MAG TPA: hypothetical protein VMR17_21230 [Xanthobacteraceae bacterium]|jgi:hypothetical protein|nr:hypothetical protein [Xanthobacteraceae bacterium]